MRQASGHWSLRATEEHLQGERRALSTRLGLSEISSEPGGGMLLPPPHELELQPFSIRSLPRARLESYTRSRVTGVSSRQQQEQHQQHLLELNRAPPPSSSDPEPDEFHDCSMDLEENSTFSNMFDDLDLEGSEMFHEEHAGGASGAASAAALVNPLIQPDINGGGSSSSRSRGPIYDPVASTGNNSRAFSCKRKSSGGAPVSFHHNEAMVIGPGHQPGVEFSRRAALVLPPPTLGASSSRPSAALMEGPRPQKTRLSSDYTSDPMFPSPASPRRESSAMINGSEPQASSQVYPRAVRRAFPHGAEGFRARRAAMLEFPELPSSGSFAGGGSREVGSPGHLGSLRSPRSFHAAGGSSTGVGGSPGISRRIGRINSSRSLGPNPSLSSQPGESRTRSMRMAILENAPGVRREASGANVNVLANAGSRHLLHPPGVGEPRQGFNSGRAGGLFAGASGGGLVAPQIAFMEPPELRAPPVFDGSQGSLRHPGLGLSRRELSRELSEGFMAIPHEFDWEHHRPRFMAGGLAEILRALERVERDEDLTREQLMMLEATTFLFGGIGLHDDHSDWRLDIDNMSYEELLALGDRIGTVSTGLTEETIAQKLKKCFYSAALARSTEDSDVKCCICQEEFEEEVELGRIECGHKYHTECIRQWLLQKNSCPICKSAAL